MKFSLASIILLLASSWAQSSSLDPRASATASIPTAMVSPSGFSDDITDWLSPSDYWGQDSQSKKQILENISVNGSVPGLVIAAQSWVHPDYTYHWIRDAALTYNCLADVYGATENSDERTALSNLFDEYIAASRSEQEDPTAISGIGEPKFYLGNNSGYQGSWGRPQTDGPALRVSTLLKYQSIADTQVPGLMNVVQADLDYLEGNWQSPTFDLWEEVNGTHFFTRYVQRKAFLDAGTYASTQNQTDLSQKYGSLQFAVTATLYQFYDYQNLFIKESLEVEHNKTSNKDVSVILAINHAYHSPDSTFAPNDPYILNTAFKVITNFIDVYPISNITTDEEGFVLAPPTVRYPEDVYDGYGTSEGNPWFLSCAGFAEFFYNVAGIYQGKEAIVLSTVSAPFWKYFTDADTSLPSLREDHMEEALEKLYGWGDAFMRTVKYHGDGYSFSEQFNKYTGDEQGAQQLTWSHASILTAAMARAKVMGDDQVMADLANV